MAMLQGTPTCLLVFSVTLYSDGTKGAQSVLIRICRSNPIREIVGNGLLHFANHKPGLTRDQPISKETFFAYQV